MDIVQHIYGTTEEWAENDIVLCKGELGIEKTNDGETRIKVGDGITPWSQLAYLFASPKAVIDVPTENESLRLTNNTEYNLGTKEAVSIDLPEVIGDEFEVIVNFHSGSFATSFDTPNEIIFTLDDCVDGRLYPIPNRIYEINIKKVGQVLLAKVNGTDYEVIE